MAVSSFLTVLAIVLLAWGLITLVRRIAEGEETGSRAARGPTVRPDSRTTAADDEIDWEELRKAEEEVRDLGADAKPEDGFEGDDWGPGAPRKPPLV